MTRSNALRRTSAVAVAGGLFLGACGGAGSGISSSGGTPAPTLGSGPQTSDGATGPTLPGSTETPQQPEAGLQPVFPSFVVKDVVTGSDVDTGVLDTRGKPVLAWFWAPH